MERPTAIKECPKHGMTEHVYIGNEKWKCKECIHDRISGVRRRYKLKLVEYKGGKCSICGYNKCLDALEFHHLNPNDKVFSLTCSDTRSYDKLKRKLINAFWFVLIAIGRYMRMKEHFNAGKRKKELERETNYFSNGGDNKKHRQSKKMIAQKLQLDEILNKIEQKIPKKQIAKDLGVSIKALRTFLSKNGISYVESVNKNITPQIEVKDFIEQFKKYRSFVKVGEHYGVTDKAIRKYCQKHNMPWRKSELVEFIKNYYQE